LSGNRPFFSNVVGSQVNELEKGHVGGKGTFGFGHFADMAVKTLNGMVLVV
jgi:hypothetical protein